VNYYYSCKYLKWIIALIVLFVCMCGAGAVSFLLWAGSGVFGLLGGQIAGLPPQPPMLTSPHGSGPTAGSLYTPSFPSAFCHLTQIKNQKEENGTKKKKLGVPVLFLYPKHLNMLHPFLSWLFRFSIFFSAHFPQAVSDSRAWFGVVGLPLLAEIVGCF